MTGAARLMSAPAPSPVAVVSLCSTSRLDHLRHQLATLDGSGVIRVVVWIGDDEPPDLRAEHIIRVPPGRHGMRLAAARNAGAAAAAAEGAELLVFLDADCVPGALLLQRYRDAASRHPDAVLCGPVTYLPPGAAVADPVALARATAPHAGRPVLAATAERTASDGEYALFWSLSFAITVAGWARTGGFDPEYEGYGGEDTDFAFALRAQGVPLIWVGGADAYHQYHETQSPPWQHIDDILRNGARFAARWRTWPMTGWLDAFADAGAIRWDGETWRRTDLDEAGTASHASSVADPSTCSGSIRMTTRCGFSPG